MKSLPNTAIVNGVIYLHSNKIAKVLPNGLWKLYSAGYLTQTTKRRLNLMTPAVVVSYRGIWHVDCPDKGKVKFFEGIEVDFNGCVIDKEN